MKRKKLLLVIIAVFVAFSGFFVTVLKKFQKKSDKEVGVNVFTELEAQID